VGVVGRAHDDGVDLLLDGVEHLAEIAEVLGCRPFLDRVPMQMT